jgi:tetratricopeptide (TPR) repeat protein
VQVIAWIGLSAALFQGRAAAQPADAKEAPSLDPRAVELFREGRALMSEGKYGAACAKLEESLRRQRGIGTLYNTADCYEKLGHTAKAWRHFRDAASEATSAGQADRAAAAQERADALEPTLMKLSIEVSAGARAIAGFELSRDGNPVPREEWGVAVAVDPGNYRVSATAPGRREWSSVLVVREPGKVVQVSVPELAVKESAPPNEVREGRSIMPAILFTGLGIAGLATGAGLTVAANQKSDDATALSHTKNSRGATPCDSYSPSDSQTALECATLLKLLEDHDEFHNGAVAAYIAGGAALGVAAAYLFWPASNQKQVRQVQLGPIVTRTEYGVRIQGHF